MTFEEEFNKFIEKWCGSSTSQLLDSDENDGERLRIYVDDNNTSKKKIKETIEKILDPVSGMHLEKELGLCL